MRLFKRKIYKKDGGWVLDVVNSSDKTIERYLNLLKKEQKDIVLACPPQSLIKMPQGSILKCQNCGRCCNEKQGSKDRGLYFEEKELRAIAKELKKSFHNLIKFAKSHHESFGRVTYIFDKPCHFYDKENQRCSVYYSRPTICRVFPFGEPVQIEEGGKKLWMTRLSVLCPSGYEFAFKFLKAQREVQRSKRDNKSKLETKMSKKKKKFQKKGPFSQKPKVTIKAEKSSEQPHVVGKPSAEDLKAAMEAFMVAVPRLNPAVLAKLVEATYDKGYLICISRKLDQEPPGDLKHDNWTVNYGRSDIFPSLDEHGRMLAPETREEAPGKPQGVKEDFDKYKDEAKPEEKPEEPEEEVEEDVEEDEGPVVETVKKSGETDPGEEEEKEDEDERDDEEDDDDKENEDK